MSIRRCSCAGIPACLISGHRRAPARLGRVRQFAQWLNGIDPAHEVPPRGLFPNRSTRQRPHIYTDAEIEAILTAASRLPSVYGLRAWTCSTLFGLIAVTGLRISESLALDSSDIDGMAGTLQVRRGKFGRQRLLPLEPSVAEALSVYAAERDRLLGNHGPAFLVTEKGTRLTDCGARYSFA